MPADLLPDVEIRASEHVEFERNRTVVLVSLPNHFLDAIGDDTQPVMDRRDQRLGAAVFCAARKLRR